jgi:hypothetical protein
LPKQPFPRAIAWTDWSDSKSAESKKKMADWVSQSDNHATSQVKWANSLPETRVDVNEAIDAVAAIHRYLVPEKKGRFYECLFVGRSLRSDILKVSHFERCTFANCNITLHENSESQFVLRRFLNCTFQGKDAKLRINRSDVINPTFRDVEKCLFEIRSSELYQPSFWEFPQSTLIIPFTTVHGGWISANVPITIRAQTATIYGFNFDGIVFTADTQFGARALVESTFKGTDLSLVEKTSPDELALMIADPRTIQPKNFPRPHSWPEFDPNYENPDEIPF